MAGASFVQAKEPWDEPLKTIVTRDEPVEKNDGPTDAASPAKAVPPTGPDGGLSWFIAALCFLINMLFSSFMRCGGLFFTSLMSTYGSTRGYASLPLSMYGGFVNLSGLLAGPLIHWFGVRTAAVFGGLMMAMGFMSSYFATGIPFLVGSLGVLAGSGHGILFSCVIVAINEYFDKRRGVALGINLTGATAASFLFAHIFDLLLSKYGLHATLAITGALLLNIAALGFLFRKPPWQESPSRSAKVIADHAQKYCSQPTPCSSEKKTEDGRPSVILRPSGALVMGPNNESSVRRRPSITSEPEGLPQEDHNAEDVLDDTAGEDELNLAWSRRGTLLSVAGSLLEEEKALCSSRRGTVISLPRKGSTIGDLDLRKLALLQEAAERLSATKSTEAVFEENAAFLGIAQVAELRSRTISEQSFTRPNDFGNQTSASMRSTVSNLGSRCTIEVPCKPEEPIRILIQQEPEHSSDSALDSVKEVLRLPRFYCHMLSYFSYSFLLDTVLAVTVDYAVDIGIDSSSAVLVLTFFSVTDTIGRLFVPLLTDFKVVSPLSLMCIAYLTIAAIALVTPCAHEVGPFWAAMIALGLPAGYILVAISEAVAVEVGLRNLPIAFGILSGLTAVGSFLRPAIIGFFRDSYGSYDGLFRLMGCMVLCSFLLTAALWIQDWRKTSTPATETSKDAVGDTDSRARAD
ncbi:hypothetical protein HPB51_019543 [Rhipicephalus microplus]|uniref:Monocarboxylate transporter n=1 Tax=Rhipicephalus microplus TaxID=6941 RepID=A0A9J6F5U2_RHIMP|nr:hypothetical protein HPB51_019543 [Rhipicephalus microplus]